MSCDVYNHDYNLLNTIDNQNSISKECLEKSLQQFIKDRTDFDEIVISKIENILTISKTLSELFENITSYALDKNFSILQKLLYIDLRLPLFLDNRIDIKSETMNTIISQSTYGEQKLGLDRKNNWGWRYSSKPQRSYKLERRETKEELEELLIASPRDRNLRITSPRYSGTLDDVIKWICEDDIE
jgi:hypothetical protein